MDIVQLKNLAKVVGSFPLLLFLFWRPKNETNKIAAAALARYRPPSTVAAETAAAAAAAA